MDFGELLRFFTSTEADFTHAGFTRQITPLRLQVIQSSSGVLMKRRIRLLLHRGVLRVIRPSQAAQQRWISGVIILFMGAASFATIRLVLGQTAPDQDVLQYTSIGLPLDKITRPTDEADAASIKFSRAAMYNPQLAAQLRENFKTPEFKQKEERAKEVILDPRSFLRAQEEEEARQTPTDAAEKAAKDRAKREKETALMAILRPVEANREKEKTKDPATKRREEIAAQSILQPREFNAAIEARKSPELRQQEADALLAFTNPDAFVQQRQRLKKTGSKEPQKSSEASREDAPRRSSDNDRPKGKEKGQEGGDR
jgi:hypothetical protein